MSLRVLRTLTDFAAAEFTVEAIFPFAAFSAEAASPKVVNGKKGARSILRPSSTRRGPTLSCTRADEVDIGGAAEEADIFVLDVRGYFCWRAGQR